MNKNNHSLALVAGEFKRFATFLLHELKPKGKVLTPFNIFAAVVLLVAAILLIIRFTKGLAYATNLSQDFPWGIWIGFDVITGVAFAGGAYVVTFMVYVLRLEKYHPIVRMTVLNGFLAYVFYAGALLFDLGRPWNVINPIIGNSFGVSSVMFLVAWHFMLYMITEFVEFSPAIAEWLGWKRVRKFLGSLTLGAVILGITLSTLHQSGLGALFLMAKNKIHPLWYTEFIPILFFVSSIFAGLSMVIFEGTISHRVFRSQISSAHHAAHDDIVIGLARVCAGTMYVYFFLKLLVFVHGQQWTYLNTPMGYWFLVEIIGFVLIPVRLFTRAVQFGNLMLVRVASGLALIGIVLNRLNVSVIAYKWYAPERYVPSWMEIEITLAVVIAEVLVLRWVVNRMPILTEPPEWATDRKESQEVQFLIRKEEEKQWATTT
jgi:Ni/Fe-hydrogenase subunit HybB-like protein